MIEVRDLVKRYGSHAAVDHLSFAVPDGQIFGFLGPNGAGKSTTMNLMTGYLAPTAGEILVDGVSITKEPEKAKGHIGYLPELPPLYMDMTVEEYLRFVARLKKVPRRGAGGAGAVPVGQPRIGDRRPGEGEMIRSRLAPLPGITALTPHHCPETGCCAFRLECAPGADLREAVFQTCAQGGLPLLELRRDTLTLEDIFLKLTSDEGELLSAFSFTQTFYNFVQYSVFDLGGVVLYLSLAGLFVFLTIQGLQKRRWS